MNSTTFPIAGRGLHVPRVVEWWRTRFLLSAGIIFLVTGLTKILMGLGKARVLGEMDPIFHISYGHLMLATGAAELLMSGMCFVRPKSHNSLLLTAWVVAGILTYRIGLSYIDWHQPCPCLGSLTGALNLQPETAHRIAGLLLAYLALGCFVFVLVPFWTESRAPSVGPLRT